MFGSKRTSKADPQRAPRAKARPVTRVSTKVAHLVGPGFVRVINENLAFASPNQSSLRLDPKSIRLIYCYGSVSWSDAALHHVMSSGAEVAMLSAMAAKCYGRIVPAFDTGTRLRSLQHQVLLDDRHQLEIGRQVTLDKLASQRAAIRHLQRHGRDVARGWLRELKELESKAGEARTLGELRGFEGAMSAGWLRQFGSLLRAPWTFPGRRRRPPTDPINALLSLASMLLINRAIALLHARGLEINLGALHEYKPGRPSLACDAIEPLRADAVERWVLRLCARRRVKPSDFAKETEDGDAIRLVPSKFADILEDWEATWFGDGMDNRLIDWSNWLEAEIRERAGGKPWKTK